MSDDDRSHIEKVTIGQSDNHMWFKERFGRITASNAKAYCGSKQNPARLVAAVLQKEKPKEKPHYHMRYGLENEDRAVEQFIAQSNDKISARKCGLFVDKFHGQLAASPDRVGFFNGEEVIVEVKCLSASRSLTPIAAVIQKQKQSNFAFQCVNDAISIKEKHKYFYQIQMQMGVTEIKKCIVVIFTNADSPVGVVTVDFDDKFWGVMKEKMLDFHAAYIVPALVNVAFKWLCIKNSLLCLLMSQFIEIPDHLQVLHWLIFSNNDITAIAQYCILWYFEGMRYMKPKYHVWWNEIYL